MSHSIPGLRDAESNPKLERELAALESQTRTASPGYETQFLNRAGNLCVEARMPRRALGYFGRAIDAYLESGRFSAAEVLCRKVLRIAPEAVRARCTLAWLAIGRNAPKETEEEITRYVEAAQRAGKEELATRQLVMMAEATPSVGLRERLAEHLFDLGSDADADRVLGMVFAERNGLRPAPVPDEGALWASLLRAALMGPQELRDQSGSAPAAEPETDGSYLSAISRGEAEEE